MNADAEREPLQVLWFIMSFHGRVRPLHAEMFPLRKIRDRPVPAEGRQEVGGGSHEGQGVAVARPPMWKMPGHTPAQVREDRWRPDVLLPVSVMQGIVDDVRHTVRCDAGMEGRHVRGR